MHRILLPLVLALGIVWSASGQTILTEAPLRIHAPGYQDIVRAYFDGASFWIDPVPILEKVGYEITLDSAFVEAVDRNRSMYFDYLTGAIRVNGDLVVAESPVRRLPSNTALLHMDTLQVAFGSDLEWDESGLSIRLSTAAELFDPEQFDGRMMLISEDPKDVLFGRERRLLGGVLVNYRVTHRFREEFGSDWYGSMGYAASMLGGAVRGQLSRHQQSAAYSLDLNSTYLTRLEAGYFQSPSLMSVQSGLSLRVSNIPLVPLRVHRTRVLAGIAEPHAIIRAQVSRITTESAQADRLGRYALDIPVFYGSTYAGIEVEPLGAAPYIAHRYYHLTPTALLPQGRVYYDAALGQERGHSSVAWGLTRHITVRGGYGYGFTRRDVGLTMLLRPTLFLDAESNIAERTGTARMTWWRPWGELNAGYRRREAPFSQEVMSAGWSLFTGAVSLRGRVQHTMHEALPSVTSLQPYLGWRSPWGTEISFTGTSRWREGIRSPLVWRSMLRQIKRVGKGIVLAEFRLDGFGNDVRAYVANVQYRAQRLDVGVSVSHLGRHELLPRVRVQWHTNWSWLSAESSWAGDIATHQQGARGAASVGRDISLSALHRETTQAIFRVFVDTNLNGRRDQGEPTDEAVELNMPTQALIRRNNGDLRAMNLVPYAVYVVEVLAPTINNPNLVPATGYRFAFTAEPGRTRRIEIPLQPLVPVMGQITGWSLAFEVLEVVLSSATEQLTVPVFGDGGFVVQLPPGLWEVAVVNRLSGEELVREGRVISNAERTIDIAITSQ